MSVKDRVEEILESLWIEKEENNKSECDFSLLRDDEAIREMSDLEYITTNGKLIKLTKKGDAEARNCVRRHRLAERLLMDVLDLKGDSVHETGCRFEHLLHKGLEENICTLLGHPATCPHGRPIPQGDCCKGKDNLKKIVMPLKDLGAKKKAKIAYLHTGNREVLKKLLAMGVFPNSEITLIQKSPSFVFQVGRSQFAVDEEMASNIFVRIL